MSDGFAYYDAPEFVSGTVFDPTDPTFGPIMAEIQAGDFLEAAQLLLDVERRFQEGAKL